MAPAVNGVTYMTCIVCPNGCELKISIRPNRHTPNGACHKHVISISDSSINNNHINDGHINDCRINDKQIKDDHLNDCRINENHINDCLTVTGARCIKGVEYAKVEILTPKRVLTFSVKVRGGEMPLASVRTDKPIPKERLRDAARSLNGVIVNAPVSIGEILLEKFIGLDANIIATSNVKKINY